MVVGESYDECDGCEYNWGSCEYECGGDSRYEKGNEWCDKCLYDAFSCHNQCEWGDDTTDYGESVVIDISTIRSSIEKLKERLGEMI